MPRRRKLSLRELRERGQRLREDGLVPPGNLLPERRVQVARFGRRLLAYSRSYVEARNGTLRLGAWLPRPSASEREAVAHALQILYGDEPGGMAVEGFRSSASAIFTRGPGDVCTYDDDQGTCCHT